ncbi:MAG: ribosomal L7Ae/L30e/S12e/Gadd45 family protein [Candidatus Aenigmatarchaeota archaeon]
MLTKLPAGKFVIGTREIIKNINSGKVTKVIVAKNCPEFLIKKISVGVEIFDGDQKDMGTKLGKPFPVAMIGYE